MKSRIFSKESESSLFLCKMLKMKNIFEIM